MAGPRPPGRRTLDTTHGSDRRSPRAPRPRSPPGTAEALFKAAQLTLQPYAVHFVSGMRLRRGKTIPSVSAPAAPAGPTPALHATARAAPKEKENVEMTGHVHVPLGLNQKRCQL